MISEELACRDLVELVTEYLEGSLPTSDRVRFEQHLSTCEGCTIYLDQMRRTIQITGHLTEESVPAPARDRLLRAFRDWKTADPDVPASERVPSDPPS